jgi:glycosyltransferase involved in cell wall biosynthesis
MAGKKSSIGNMQKIRVGFIGYNNMSWLGGINYLKNLLFAINNLKDQNIEAYIFFERNADPSVIEIFKEYANCIFLTFDSPRPLFAKILTRISGRNHFLNYYVGKYKIDVISHLKFNEIGIKTKIIGWIPDFQHLYLPEMFNENELNLRDIYFRELILGSDRMIVSSHDALKDCISFEKLCIGKTKVLHFVSQIDNEVYRDEPEFRKKIFEKFRLPEKYFFLPNQFWKHKNHTVVFKAIELLKRQGTDITLVCSGNFQAFENAGYIDSLLQLMKDLQIEGNVILLGMISYLEVQMLMRYSVSVINPSYFEGWSSSVEECKSMGKNMIVSDMPVHKEQNPPETFYFNPDDEKDLAEKMKKKLELYSGGPDFNLELIAKEKLPERTLEFARSYESIILELVNRS